jgi:hypothetical protein
MLDSVIRDWLEAHPSPGGPLRAPSQSEWWLISPWEIAIFNPSAQVECSYKPSFIIFFTLGVSGMPFLGQLCLLLGKTTSCIHLLTPFFKKEL